MPDDEPDGRSFEDVARALADEVHQAVERLSAIDLDDVARAANEEAERARRWIEDLARSLTQTGDAAMRSEDAPVHHAAPHPLAMPTALGGKGGAGTNPEQLFAAGYAACFESALRLVARMQKKPLKDATITARVTIGKTDDGGFGLAAELHGHIEGVSREEAQTLMEAAHLVCTYSRATRGNIEVKLVAE